MHTRKIRKPWQPETKRQTRTVIERALQVMPTQSKKNQGTGAQSMILCPIYFVDGEIFA